MQEVKIYSLINKMFHWMIENFQTHNYLEYTTYTRQLTTKIWETRKTKR